LYASTRSYHFNEEEENRNRNYVGDLRAAVPEFKVDIKGDVSAFGTFPKDIPVLRWTSREMLIQGRLSERGHTGMFTE